MPRRRRQGRRRARARRIAPLALLGLLAAALVPASASADPSAFSGTLTIVSVTPPAAANGLAHVVADAEVAPQCDASECAWRPVVETVAQGETCESDAVPVWTGPDAGSASQRFSPSWHELPTATPMARRACLFARTGEDEETLVAQADYTVPAASAPHGGPDTGLLRTPIPRWVAPVRRHWPFRVSTAGLPHGVGRKRFVALVHAAGVRWGLPYAGTTRAASRVRDGRNAVGFSRDVPHGALGVTVVQVLAYRRAGQIIARRVVEQDTFLRYDAPWEPGPALPDSRHFDLQTAVIHELGHYAGNRHARDCRDTPMWVSLRVGEWWHSPTDWFQHGCGIALAARRATESASDPRRLLVRVHERVVTLR